MPQTPWNHIANAVVKHIIVSIPKMEHIWKSSTQSRNNESN